MKKEASGAVALDNSFGVASVILGILSILLLSTNGVILGVIALIFANKQRNKHETSWSRAGRILSIIGIIVGIILIGVTAYAIKNNLLPQLNGLA